MSVSLIVSPLCRMRYVDVKGLPHSAETQSPVPGVYVSAMSWDEVEKHLRSPPKAGVIKWRDALSRKYRSQLGEPLTWDEDTSFTESEDLGWPQFGMLIHAAARIDLLGELEAARQLTQRSDIPLSETSDFIDKSSARGYLSKFPQLLLGVNCWLPFRRDMIIEEPDPLGERQRFGSLFALRQQIETIRTFILNAEPSATQPSADKRSALQNAWWCAVTMSRLTTDAIAHRVPMTLSE
jgi:hypothetical protein